MVVAVLVVAACAQPPLSADEYFTEFEAIRIDFNQANADIDSRYTAELASLSADLNVGVDPNDEAQVAELANRSLEVSIDVTSAFVVARLEGLGRYADDLTKLRPPDLAEAPHSASLAALEEASVGLEPTLEAVASAARVGDIGELVNSSPFGLALVRLGEACRVLQGIAIGEGLVVDLRCPPQ